MKTLILIYLPMDRLLYRISQYDLNKQRLYYIYPQTAHVTWSHPLGSEADTQELERFYQIQQLQKEQYGESDHGAYTKAYNRQGGMGKNAAIAMGLMAGMSCIFGLVHFFVAVHTFRLDRWGE
jgi:hypothetical protein